MNEYIPYIALALAGACLVLLIMVLLEQKRQLAKLRRQAELSTKSMGEVMQPMLMMQKNQIETIDRHLEMSQRQSQAMARQSDEFQARAAHTLAQMGEENRRQLEHLRGAVDQQLSVSLQRRLDSSFSQVSQRLEQVYKGLGEMQELAKGVGDLKRVLTNVKARGVYGENQLEAILEEVLTKTQYTRNAAIKKGSQERVDFAVKMPGHGDEPVYLPIDAKFPQEDYLQLVSAQEQGDKALIDQAAKALETAIKVQAKSIHDKYILPPVTTDFAIMFLPSEGLYAEVLRRDNLNGELYRRYQVVPAGPTTLIALLDSLRLGFRSVAIEQRSAEVFALLAEVKRDFAVFSDALDKTGQRLRQAGDSIEDAQRKTRVLERRLKALDEGETPGSGEF